MYLNTINDLEESFNKLVEKAQDNLTWKISDEIFLRIINSNFAVIFLNKSKLHKKIINGKNMALKLFDNIEIIIDNNKIVQPGVVLECISTDEELKKSFFLFMTTIINNFDLIKENLYEELYKLWQLFERERIYNENKVVGFLGELLVIHKFLEEFKINISEHYHLDASNKWDFEFNNSIVMEVKTTVTEERKHTFSYLQLQNNLETVIASVIIQKRDQGIYLFDFSKMLLTKINNYDFSIQVNTFLFINKININNKGPVFDLSISLNSIKFYLVSDLPKFNEIPDGVFHITYGVSLENVKDIKKEELLKILFNN